MANMGLYLGLGVAAIAGGYLFLTKDGKNMINGFMDSSISGGLGGGSGSDFEDIRKSAIGLGYDDPFKYMTEKNADAWDPTSKRYKDIISGDRKRNARKKLQQHYIESYLSSAFI
jgi:hypothetical protein